MSLWDGLSTRPLLERGEKFAKPPSDCWEKIFSLWLDQMYLKVFHFATVSSTLNTKCPHIIHAALTSWPSFGFILQSDLQIKSTNSSSTKLIKNNESSRVDGSSSPSLALRVIVDIVHEHKYLCIGQDNGFVWFPPSLRPTRVLLKPEMRLIEGIGN